MRIALIGYGKMGKAIEQIAISRGHSISVKAATTQDVAHIHTDNTDVAIEFTTPESAFSNISYCISLGIPVVSGSTGWLDHFDEAVHLCNEKKGAFFYASNYSVGVNIFFNLNQWLAKMMNQHPEYAPSVEEIHHTEKKDAPSGTAITLAEGILSSVHTKTSWINQETTDHTSLEIISKRIDKTPGTHTIRYASNVDSIEITHTAHSREGFAQGATLAAEWLLGKTGVFGMNDMLKL